MQREFKSCKSYQILNQPLKISPFSENGQTSII